MKIKPLLIVILVSLSTLSLFAQETWTQDGNTSRGRFLYNSAGALGYGVRTAAGGGWAWQLVDASNNSYFHVQYPTGYVGIGTTNPINILDVNGIGRFRRAGSTTAGLAIGGDALSLQGWGLNNPYIEWRNSDNTRQGYMGWNTNRLSLVLENGHNFTVENGNMGVGTATPAFNLDVAGTIRSNGYLRTTNVGGGQGYFADDAFGSTIFSISRQANNETRLQSFGFHTFFSGGNTGTEKMRITADGNVGIGTTNPINLLDVNGIGRFRRAGSTTSGFAIGGDALTLQGWGISNPYIEWRNLDYTRQGYMGWNTNRLSLVLENGYNFTVENGNVGIGTTTPDAKLAVKGTIHANEVRVDLNVQGPDYVFEPTYHLKPLAEIEAYIKENKHLPEVPSAKEMEKNGVQLGEMNMLLLKKIEEMTLYVIELKKRDEAQQKEIEKIKTKK
jgi:hypothetical protein